MISRTTLLAAVLLAATVGGCNESRRETQADVADAQAEATATVEQARRDASENIGKLGREAVEKTAGEIYDLAITKAEADHKVEIQRCEGSTGASREACKTAADETLDLAKQSAKATRDSHTR